MNWREMILHAFVPQVARLTVVADPDGLLTEEIISQEIRQRGFDLVMFDDSLHFRYLYESEFRSRWDAGETVELALVVPGDVSLVDSMPYDWLAGVRRLHFSLQSLFPHLNNKVVQALDRSLLDALYQAQATYHPARLSELGTCDFILRHVFEIAPEVINQPSELLRVLLRRHYNRLLLPTILETRLIEVLAAKPVFNDWPLAQIILDRQTFLAFIQERWPLYLASLAQNDIDFVREAPGTYPLTVPGPTFLPFGHDDVRVYVDNLFLDGLLKPVEVVRAQALVHTWARIGIHHDRTAENLQRLERLLNGLESEIPDENQSYHTAWTSFALRFATLNHLWHTLNVSDQKIYREQYHELQQKTDHSFQVWLNNRYSGLATLPGIVMVHHIARALRSHLESQSDIKLVLIVVDGLALDQWITLRGVLNDQHPMLEMEQNVAFAWVPTLTSVSRQAIFAGRAPFYFAGSIYTTEKEGALWSQYWADSGIPPIRCGYLRGLGERSSLQALTNLLDGHPIQILGLVVDKVDKIMHGMQLGATGMHNQVHQWMEHGFFAQLLDLLVEHGFTIYLTADHGNIEAIGCGKPNEGAVADLRGERVRIYPTPELRDIVQTNFPGSGTWPSIGLPPNYLPLLAPQRSAFITSGERTVAHGGATIEEVIVPLIKISKRTL